MVARLRQTARLALAGLLYYSGLLALWGRLRRSLWVRGEVCVLGLHRVLGAGQAPEANSLPAIVLREENFARLLEYLARRYRVVSLEEFLSGPAGNGGARRPACLITFDDGWRDTYTTAYPWLKKYKMPAAVFLATGFLGTPRTFWIEELLAAGRDPARRQTIAARAAQAGGMENWIEQLKRMPSGQRERVLDAALGPDRAARPARGDEMMRWEEAAEMARDGVSFGAHTVTHPLLTFEDQAAVERELVESRRMIEQRLGRPVLAFAYPNGDWNDRVRGQVQKAGYECAFTTRTGWHRPGRDRLTVRRILLHDGNLTGWGGRFSPAALSFTLARRR